MEYNLGKVLITEKELHEAVQKLADKITSDYRGKELVCICVLKGAVVFLTDLVRAIGRDVDVRFDFLAISSYGESTKSNGVVRIQKDISTDIHEKNVLIVEDIVDTGLSLSYLRGLLVDRHPSSLAVCVLFDKKERRKVDVKVEYTGIVIPDKFVVGYGLDVAGKYRNLPDLHVIEQCE